MENIGDALCRQLVVEAVLQDVFLLVGLGFAPFQSLVLRVIVEMLELALAQFAVESLNWLRVSMEGGGLL
jgi:hypothetical protein